MINKRLVFYIALAVAAPTVAANLIFNFIPTSGGTLSSGTGGTLPGDNNTVVVSSVSIGKVNGAPGPAIGFVGSNATFVGGADPTIVTRDDTKMYLFAYESKICDNFLFSVTNPVVLGGQSVGFDDNDGTLFEIYQPANRLRNASEGDLPEPARWAILIGSWLTVAAMARRRFAVVCA